MVLILSSQFSLQRASQVCLLFIANSKDSLSGMLLVLLNLLLLSQSSSVGSSSSLMNMLKQINVMLRHAPQDMLPESLQQLTFRDNPWEVIGFFSFLPVLVLIIIL